MRIKWRELEIFTSSMSTMATPKPSYLWGHPQPFPYSRLYSKASVLPFRLPGICCLAMIHTKIWTPLYPVPSQEGLALNKYHPEFELIPNPWLPVWSLEPTVLLVWSLWKPCYPFPSTDFTSAWRWFSTSLTLWPFTAVFQAVATPQL